MKQIAFFKFLCMLLLLGACKKKEYPTSVSENEPVFFMRAVIDGKYTSVTAGIDDYQMFSELVYENSKYKFIGNIKPINCSNNCSNSIRIIINDYKNSQINSPIRIDSSITTGVYDYSGSSYLVKFKSTFNKLAAFYQWDFGDGSSSNLADPTHVYKNAGRYTVSLTIRDVNGCSSTISSVKQIGFIDAVDAKILSATSASNAIQFSQLSTGKTPRKYYWDFGDGSTSTEASPIHTYNHMGAYPVWLKVTDADGVYAIINYNAVTNDDGSSCAANFELVSIEPQLNSSELNKVEVIWTDSNGVQYSTNNTAQSTGSIFKIISIEDYLPNEKGEPTKKLRLSFDCKLSNGNSTVNVKSGEATITVSYK